MKHATGFVIAGLALLTLFVLAPAATAETAVRFAPVQEGHALTAQEVSLFAPGRLRVKFTEDGIASSPLATVEMRRGAVSGRALTGHPAVDALLLDAGVTRIERQHGALKDRAFAAEYGLDRWFVVHFSETADVEALAARLEADPAIEYALPDWRLFPDAVPNDTYYWMNWGHDNQAQLLSYDWTTHTHEAGDPVGTVGFDCNAPEAWDALGSYGSSGVVIGILDSGVDVDHPDIPIVAGYDFGDNDNDPDDDSPSAGHGTCCAGIAAAIANNGVGAAGTAGGCSIMPLKIASSDGSMYLSTMAPALYWAVDNGADVISISLSADKTSDPDIDPALLYAWNNDVPVCASTSNYNQSYIRYPAYSAYTFAIGAASPCGERKRSAASKFYVNPGVETDPNDYTCDGERWWGSNYGVTTPDVAGAVTVLGPTILPTTDILGSGGFTSGDYEMWFNGTSCATPYVAGVCALIVSANPAYSVEQVYDALTSTATDVVSVESVEGWDRYAGYGMANAELAVGGGGDYPPVAQFFGVPTSGPAPLTVQFTDESANEPTSWFWDFGDQVGTSYDQNPSYEYTQNGTYTVSLTSTNAYGEDTEIKTAYITVADVGDAYAQSETPVAGNVSGDYTDTQASDDTRESITEVASSSHPWKFYSYLEHRWTFSVTSASAPTFYVEGYRPSNTDGDDFVFAYSTDGSTYYNMVTIASGTEQVYSYVLPEAVNGTVYVRVRDTNRTDGATSMDAVYVDEMYFETVTGPQPPVADFAGVPTAGVAPLGVQFTDLSTGDPYEWYWDFGDLVGTSDEANPYYTYNDPGSYTVTLTVTNAQGEDTEVKTAYISVSDDELDALHVADMLVDRIYGGVNCYGAAYVTVEDQYGVAKQGAAVYGYFNAPDTSTKSGVTDEEGVVRILATKTKTPPAEYCFTVTDIVLSGYAYDEGANVVTTACESGWQSAAVDVDDAEEAAGPGLRLNRPNPFSSETEIVFALGEESRARIEIFNVAGRSVAVLADRVFAAGPHAIAWDASGHPSGVYFCRLTSGEMVESKRMMLIR